MMRTRLSCIKDVAISRSLLRTTKVVRCRGIRVISMGGKDQFRACAVYNGHKDKVVYLGNTTTEYMDANSGVVVVYCTRCSSRRTGRRGPRIIFMSRRGGVDHIAGCRGRKLLGSVTWLRG